MDRCPPEIWMKIASFACTDDGLTCRSLSLVSKSFHDISKPFKLQSIALRGADQTVAFATLLKTTPPHLRRVHNLLIRAGGPQINLLADFSVVVPLFRQRAHLIEVSLSIMESVADTIQVVVLLHDGLMRQNLLYDAPVLTELTIHWFDLANLQNATIPCIPSLQRMEIFNGDQGRPEPEEPGIFHWIPQVAPCLNRLRLTGANNTFFRRK
jgi:hypothetical protein